MGDGLERVRGSNRAREAFMGLFKNLWCWAMVRAHAFKLSTQEVEAGGSLRVRGLRLGFSV